MPLARAQEASSYGRVAQQVVASEQLLLEVDEEEAAEQEVAKEDVVWRRRLRVSRDENKRQPPAKSEPGHRLSCRTAVRASGQGTEEICVEISMCVRDPGA